jgi:hypothetical protein
MPDAPSLSASGLAHASEREALDRSDQVADALRIAVPWVPSSAEVTAAHARLAGQGPDTATEENVACCYAVQGPACCGVRP